MKRIVSAIFVFLLAVLMFFTACSKKQENPLIGTWEEVVSVGYNDEEHLLRNRFVFRSDGTGEGIGSLWLDDTPEDADNFTYTLGDGEIYVDAPYNFSITCTYHFEGEKLILTIPYNPDKPFTCELTKVSE